MGTSVISLKNSQGFTLLEVLVAIVISVILLGGAIKMLSSGKRVYAMQSELAQMQTNARFVMDELNQEVRMAGYFGCSGTPPTGEIINPFYGSENNSVIKKSSDGTNISGAFPVSDKIAINSFNQVITVTIPINNLFNQNTTSFTLDANNDFWPKTGETIIVSDCAGSDRYTVTNDTSDTSLTMNITPGLTRGYGPFPEIFTGKTHIIYEVKMKDDGDFALYQTRCENIDQDSDPCETGVDIVEGNTDPLIDNVETLQVRYGFNIELDDDALGVDADTVNDLLAFDNNNDNQRKLIPDFYLADYQPFCDTLDTDGTAPDTYSFCVATPALLKKVIFPIAAVRITLLMRTATKHYDEKRLLTDKLFQLDPDSPPSGTVTNIPYNPKNNPLEGSYRHRMFTAVMAVRNAK